jgi:DNA-directed RNA polymerase subunit delta
MEELKAINPKLSEADIAYQILKMDGQGKNFRELMQQVLTIKGIPAENPQLMASLHTQITLDNRFIFMGQGVWGLKEWSQSKVVRRTIPHNSASRTVPFRRRSLQDEMEYEDGEFSENYESSSDNEEEEWEE